MHQSFRQLKPSLTAREPAVYINRAQLVLQVVVPELLPHLVFAAGTPGTAVCAGDAEGVAAVALVDRHCEVVRTAGTLEGGEERWVGL